MTSGLFKSGRSAIQACQGWLPWLALVAVVAALHPATAQACPMCSQTIAEQKALPQAYMYSILFMLGMPAIVLGGIGGTIYWKFRQFARAAQRQVVPQPQLPEPAQSAAAAAGCSSSSGGAV